MDLDPWDYALPDACIARFPAPERDGSRMLHVSADALTDRHFRDLPSQLRAGDHLVVNDTRVMRARLQGTRQTGGKLEVLLLEPGPGPVRCMIRNARRLKPGERFSLAGREAVLVERLPEGLFSIEVEDPASLMASAGSLPLPPYFGRDAEPEDDDRYQTVYAGPLGAAAAPTAGLHFTPAVFAALEARGISVHPVTLHVGIGTFRPLRSEDLEADALHPEVWSVPQATADALQHAERIIAVGTTSVRTLEAATPPGETRPRAGTGTTRIFLRPGRPPRVVDGLITNFHLPRSSLLMLVASLMGRERLLATYREAIQRGYRFYSYGDAMLLLD